ncbi:MAG: hypothetical protein ACLF0G_04700 [Candidatus Brocadiia bacterium]
MAKESGIGLFRRLVAALAEVVAALAVVVEAAVVWFAVTLFLHGLCALVAGLGLVVRVWAKPVKTSRRHVGLMALGLALLGFGGTFVGREIAGHFRRHSTRLESCYLRSGPLGVVLRAGNVVPEADLALLAAKAARLARALPAERMAEVTGLLRDEYGAMRDEEPWAHLGNVAAVGLAPSASGHFFRYLPLGYTSDKRWPLLLFLHGEAGNLALFPRLWAEFADRRGFVVVCPTYDRGRWGEEAAVELAGAALDDTLEACSIDEQRIYLVGFSAGAAEGWTLLDARPQTFRGFVSIASSRFSAAWQSFKIKTLPVLFLHGSKDRVSPPACSRKLHQSLAQLRRPGTLVELPEEDHFLLLRSMDKVTAEMWRWMEGL